MIGVYDVPPPEGSGITGRPIDVSENDRDFFNRELLKTARAATKIKDWLHGLIH